MKSRVVYRKELREFYKCCRATLNAWIAEGKIPEPDVKFSRKMTGWYLSTLVAAGINVE